MLTILSVTQNVNYSNQEVSTTLTKSSHSKAIEDMIIHDIPKIGYQEKGILSNIFVKADSTEISFYSNLDDAGNVELVTWKYTDAPVTNSKNPNDEILVRTVDGDKTEITVGVTKFRINYYDSYGSDIPMTTPVSSSDFSKIVQVEIELELQSNYTLSQRNTDSGRYTKTYWKKRFSPVNLRPNN